MDNQLSRMLYTIKETNEHDDDEIQCNGNSNDNVSGKYMPPSTQGKSVFKYHKSQTKKDEVLLRIKDDIYNYRVLNKYQIQYIQNLPQSQLVELIIIYNNCITQLND